VASASDVQSGEASVNASFDSESDAELSGEAAEGTDLAEAPVLGPFSPEAATTALEQARGAAQACRAGDDPPGTAKVLLTFAPSGKVTTATVTGRSYSGTPTGSCIARSFRSARVPAFDGDFVTVSKTVVFQ
jgi:hypothetical protein